MCSLCLARFAFMFIKLCFNFMSIFVHLSLMWPVTFFLISPLVRVVQSCHRQIWLRYLQLIVGLLVIFLLGVYCC
jgi:hypothetical protein